MAWTVRAAGTAASGTTSVAPAQPTGTSAGDILLAFIVDHATSGSSAAPTGWTYRGGVAGSSGRCQVFSAIVGQNGLTGTSWTFSGLTTRAEGVIVAFAGGDPSVPLDNVTVSTRLNASGTVGTTSITPNSSGDMIVAAFAALASGSTWSAEATTSPGALTELLDSANSTYCSIAVAYGTQTTAGATGASTVTMGTAGANAAILLALRQNQTHLYNGSGNVTLSGAAVTSFTTVGTGTSPSVVRWTDATIGTASFTTPTAQGNVIVVTSQVSPHTVSITGITDNKGNVYQKAASATNSLTDDLALEIWYAQDAYGGVTTVTASYSGSGGSLVRAFEATGLSNVAVDAVGVANNLAVTGGQLVGPSFTTDTTTFVVLMSDANNGTTSISAPFTFMPSYMWAYGNAVPAGSYSPTWTAAGSTDGLAIAAAFKAGTTGGSAFSYSASGAIAIAGAAAAQMGVGYAGSGTVAISGAATRMLEFARSGSGSITVTGAATTSYYPNYAYLAAGNVAIAGTATTSYTASGAAFAYSGSGNVTITGAATRALEFARSGSGSITITGAATTSYYPNYAYAAGGNVAIIGAAAAQMGVAYAGAGSISIAGAAATAATAKYTYAGSGVVSMVGAGITGYSTPSSNAYSGSGSITVAGAALTSYRPNYTYTGAGVATISGAGAGRLGVSYSGSGTLAISGAATARLGVSYAGSGSVSISGAAQTTYSSRFAFSGSGNITIAGAAQTLFVDASALVLDPKYLLVLAPRCYAVTMPARVFYSAMQQCSFGVGLPQRTYGVVIYESEL